MVFPAAHLNPDISERLSSSHVPALQCVGRDLRKFYGLCTVDPEMALVRARRILEVIIGASCESANITVGTKSLETLLTELSRAAAVPDLVMRHIRTLRDFGNLAAHATRTDSSTSSEWIDMSDAELRVCEISLLAVIRWFEQTTVTTVAMQSPFTTVESNAVTVDLISQAVALDRLVYSNEYRGTLELCKAWHCQNPEIYVMLIYRPTGHLVGYINAMPLQDTYFARIEAGDTIDMELPPEALRRYDLPDFYRLYLSSIVVHPDFQGSAAFKALFDAYTEKLLRLAKADVFITEAIADAVTPQGQQVARTVGMKPVRCSKHNSTIYKLIMLPPSLRYPSRSGQCLATFYQRKYEDYRELLVDFQPKG